MWHWMPCTRFDAQYIIVLLLVLLPVLSLLYMLTPIQAELKTQCIADRSQRTVQELIKFIRSFVPSSVKNAALHRVSEMFEFAYGNYLTFAFPHDELNPIDCTGRGHDHAKPDNINVNDALGDYQLTLVDSLDTLVVMGKLQNFTHAVQLLLKHLSFDRDVRVQVFEATIRVIGGLLSAHMLITDPTRPFGDLRPNGYDGELLSHAHDLANRMLDAFQDSPSGLPYPRFYLGSGRKDNTTTETCLAGAGSLLFEFGCLSALLGDPSYASLARRVVFNLWNRRSSVTGLLGSTIDVKSGSWINRMSGIGAGQDSFYEYLHKTSILFGDEQMGHMFDEALRTLRYHLRSSNFTCLNEKGIPAIYWNVNMYTGERMNYWIDSLQSFWPGIFAQHGDLNEAVCQHAIHFFIWQLYGLPPERYDFATEKPQLHFYPLRPEFVESTYFLYRATRHPFYLHVGEKIIDSLNKYARSKCGFATIHNVQDKSQEDRMESFFLSETLKYLYLLFDEDNPLNKNELDYVFSTQAHIFPVKRIRELIKQLPFNPFQSNPSDSRRRTDANMTQNKCSCSRLPKSPLPMDRQSWQKIGAFVHTQFRTQPDTNGL